METIAADDSTGVLDPRCTLESPGKQKKLPKSKAYLQRL